MKLTTPLAAALLLGTLALGGCAKDHAGATGNQGTFVGHDDPAIDSAAPSAAGTHMTGGTGTAVNGGGGSSPAGTSGTAAGH